MKKLIAIILAVMLLAVPVCAAGNAQTIELTIGNPNMTVDGVSCEIDPGRGTVPIVENGRTLVPIRAIVEAMGGNVTWVQEAQLTFLEYNGDIITLEIGGNTAFLNSEASTLDVAPVIIDGRTLMPIRFISESFKFKVDWDQETQTVTISK